MLCVNLESYKKTCNVTSGGVAKIWQFDPSDFDWTQTSTGTGVAEVKGPYTAVALKDGALVASGAKFYEVEFEIKEAEFNWKRDSGRRSSYTYDLMFRIPEFSQTLTNFCIMLDRASLCCSIGYVILMNTGKIFVIGEKYVNGVVQVPFEILHNDSEGKSGKEFKDFTGGDLKMQGQYSRPPFEWTGGIAALQAFM